MEKYKFLEHTADIKFVAYGKTLEEVYGNCASAVSASMYEDKIKEKVKRSITVEGDNLGALLYNFVEEILFLVDSEEFLTTKTKVKISKNQKKLTAEIYGDSTENYNGIEHIKSVTYNEMYIKKTAKGWEAQVVLDV